MLIRNISHTQWHRSTSRHRITPCTAGIGPLSTTAARAARCASFNSDGWPGPLPSIRPAGPRALNLTPFAGFPTAAPLEPLRQLRPVSHNLQRYPADPGRIAPSPTLVDGGQRKQPSGLTGMLALTRKHPQTLSIKIVP